MAGRSSNHLSRGLPHTYLIHFPPTHTWDVAPARHNAHVILHKLNCIFSGQRLHAPIPSLLRMKPLSLTMRTSSSTIARRLAGGCAPIDSPTPDNNAPLNSSSSALVQGSRCVPHWSASLEMADAACRGRSREGGVNRVDRALVHR